MQIKKIRLKVIQMKQKMTKQTIMQKFRVTNPQIHLQTIRQVNRKLKTTNKTKRTQTMRNLHNRIIITMMRKVKINMTRLLHNRRTMI